MPYIFLDESGDLGFDPAKRRSTQYFVVTFLITDAKRPIEKLIRRTHRGLRKRYRMRGGVLHASHEDDATCSRVCSGLAQRKCKIMTIYLNKQKVYTRLQDEKHVLYNYVVNILLDRIVSKRLVTSGGSIMLVASRRETNKFLNQNFADYLARQVLANHKLPIEVKIKTPHEEKALQAVDFASWAIFRRHEYGDDRFYRLLQPIIVEENPLF